MASGVDFLSGESSKIGYSAELRQYIPNLRLSLASQILAYSDQFDYKFDVQKILV